MDCHFGQLWSLTRSAPHLFGATPVRPYDDGATQIEQTVLNPEAPRAKGRPLEGAELQAFLILVMLLIHTTNISIDIYNTDNNDNATNKHLTNSTNDILLTVVRRCTSYTYTYIHTHLIYTHIVHTCIHTYIHTHIIHTHTKYAGFPEEGARLRGCAHPAGLLNYDETHPY